MKKKISCRFWLFLKIDWKGKDIHKLVFCLFFFMKSTLFSLFLTYTNKTRKNQHKDPFHKSISLFMMYMNSSNKTKISTKRFIISLDA